VVEVTRFLAGVVVGAVATVVGIGVYFIDAFTHAVARDYE
jgi:hypothetical protein